MLGGGGWSSSRRADCSGGNDRCSGALLRRQASQAFILVDEVPRELGDFVAQEQTVLVLMMEVRSRPQCHISKSLFHSRSGQRILCYSARRDSQEIKLRAETSLSVSLVVNTPYYLVKCKRFQGLNRANYIIFLAL